MGDINSLAPMVTMQTVRTISPSGDFHDSHKPAIAIGSPAFRLM